MPYRRQIHVDPRMRHGVFRRVVIKVFNNAPEPPSVGFDHHRLLRRQFDIYHVSIVGSVAPEIERDEQHGNTHDQCVRCRHQPRPQSRPAVTTLFVVLHTSSSIVAVPPYAAPCGASGLRRKNKFVIVVLGDIHHLHHLPY